MKLNIISSGLLLICVSTANLNATIYTNEIVDTACSRLEGGKGDCNMSHACALSGTCDFKVTKNPVQSSSQALSYSVDDACSEAKGGSGDCNASFNCIEGANCNIKVVASPDTKIITN